jgi:arylsulfatase A-like enzyme
MPKKNVLIIHTDQQRYDSLGCTGNAYARTPNLDRLASEGTLFTRHISGNPVCMPSRASLYTGLYPPAHGVWSNGVALNRGEYVPANEHPDYGDVVTEPPTIADVFARAGYDTAAFGKLHLTPFLAPASYGYPESFATWDAGVLDDWHGPYYGFRHVELVLGHGEGPCRTAHYGRWLRREHPDLWQAVRRKERSFPIPGFDSLYPTVVPAELHHSAWLGRQACAYLEDERPSGRPFLAFVGFPDPHHPFAPARETIDLFEGTGVVEPLDPEGRGTADHPHLSERATRHDISHLSREERNTIIRYTNAMIYQIDVAVGHILDTLQSLDLWDHTIVVFTCDHGDFMGQHGLLFKLGTGSDALLHVPLILHAPGAGLPARVDTPVSNCDVLPTLAALAGVELAAWQHGKDVCPIVESDEEHHALAYCLGGREPRWGNYTVYDATHRLTYYPRLDYVELFDHRRDPGETTNLAATRGSGKTVRRLMQVVQEQALAHTHPIVGHTGAW